MRNLVISTKSKFDFDWQDNDFIGLSDEGPISYKSGLLYQHGNNSDILADLSPILAEESLDVASEKCSGLVWFSDGRLVVSFESGLLVTSSLDTCELVGTFPTGIDGIWKSPDDEILTLAGKDGAIILMTSRDFEPLIEFQPEDSSPSEAAFANVSVGWGTKETQFHGKAGKQAAQNKDAVQAEQEVFDLKTNLVWRDDGQFFAVSSVSKSDGIRRIRVFNRQAQLQSTSEAVRSLGQPLDWKPLQGALITSSLKMPNGQNVVGFFEKNGLRHGEFQVAKNEVQIMDVAWNCDATVLAVQLKHLDENDVEIQLWTCSNYKWQLKKSWKNQDAKKTKFIWDVLSPMTLFILNQNHGNKYEMKWKIHASQGKTEQDLSWVAVIDGAVLKMTPFRQMIVPPPISAFELHFNSNVKDVIFNDSNSLWVITEDMEIYEFEPGNHESNGNEMVKLTGAGGNGFVPKCTTLLLAKNCVKMPQIEEQAEMYNWIAQTEYFLASNDKTLFVFDKQSMKLLKRIQASDVIFDILNSENILLMDGTVLKLNLDLELVPVTHCDHIGKCTKLEAVNDLIIGLDEKTHRLYLNGQEIAHGITSFYIHSHFLMVTTVQHTLKCLPLDNLAMNPNETEKFWSSESVRALERGSKLVLAVSCDPVTVLQMPRGNLEVIRPRALSLYILKSLLDQKNYKEVMEIMRRQRINLNLIVDHDPQLFKSNIQAFIQQVENTDRLCVFIADLMNEDVTKTMYASMYNRPESKSKGNGSKVDDICHLLLNTLSSNKTKYILPMISCHVKSSQSSVANALLEIQSLTDEKLADSALNFLLLLVNVNELFDVALGMYDFDLVLLVAEKSQKDPKEYLPLLNNLKNLDNEHYRKHKIDMHLKRYKSALGHIAQAGDSYLEECLSLIKDQRLYLEAMPLFAKGTQAHVQVSSIYGEYLMSKKYFEDAALVFESANLNSQAVNAWEQSGQWTYCLALAKSVMTVPSDFQALCLRLVEHLKETNKHWDASQILVQHLNDPEEAIVSLIQGQCWNQSLHLIQLENRQDLYETNLKPALASAAQDTLANLEKKVELFHEYLERFNDVVHMKEKLAEGNFEETDINIEDADMYSDVTSLANASLISKTKSNPGSLKTRASSNRSKSSRSKRKQELKKYSTKEGSKYEDLGLMAALHDLISQVYKTTFQEIGALNRILVKFDYFAQAKKLQTIALKFQEDIKTNLEVIWNPGWISDQQDMNEVKFGPGATTQDVIDRAFKETKYKPELSILEAKYRYAPAKPPGLNDWQLQMLM